MKKPSEQSDRDSLRNKIIGLGEKSIRKSYYPELQQRINELETTNRKLLEQIAVRKEAEKTKEKLEEQLRQALKMEAIGTLAGGIAHDFNNILTAIIGYTDLAKLNIKKNCIGGSCLLDNDLDRVLEASHRARQLIKQILTFSRQQKSAREPVQLSMVIKEALNLLRSSIPSTIEIQHSILEDDEHIMAVSSQVHQVVMNLVTNSYHSMRDQGGKLMVKLSRTTLSRDDIKVSSLHLVPGSYLVLEVSDTGEGMTRTVMDRIFDPYFTTRGDSGGTGMGLAVVHGIVKEHGGHISVYSEPGKGTNFKVYFPQIIASVIHHVASQQEEIPEGNEKILLVDDEKIVLDLEKAILEKLGYSVVACLTPGAALEMLQKGENDFDLVMTDMTMPKMNGAQLTQKILHDHPIMPIIICTGFSELIDKNKAMAIGARGFVMKPLVLREIAGTIRGVLDRNN